MTSEEVRRDPLDRYYTHPDVARVCIGVLADVMGHAPDRVLEPCAGAAPFLTAALACWPRVALQGCDADHDAPSLRRPELAVEAVGWESWRPGIEREGERVWCVTNPPFAGYRELVAGFVERAGDRWPRVELLALLLRESAVAHLLAGPHPPDAVWMTPIRPMWGGPGGELLARRSKTGKASPDNVSAALLAWSPRLRRPAGEGAALRLLPASRVVKRGAHRAVQVGLFG